MLDWCNGIVYNVLTAPLQQFDAVYYGNGLFKDASVSLLWQDAPVVVLKSLVDLPLQGTPPPALAGDCTDFRPVLHVRLTAQILGGGQPTLKGLIVDIFKVRFVVSANKNNNNNNSNNSNNNRRRTRRREKEEEAEAEEEEAEEEAEEEEEEEEEEWK